jgi:hypothetical protein
MSGLEAAVAEAAAVPGAFGAILCDFEGEAVAWKLGAAELPGRVLDEARRHVPEGLGGAVAPADFLLRLAGAEPCALLALFGRQGQAAGVGALEALEIGYARVGLLAALLPDDYYLVVVLDRRRARGFGCARRAVARVAPVLAREIQGAT